MVSIGCNYCNYCNFCTYFNYCNYCDQQLCPLPICVQLCNCTLCNSVELSNRVCSNFVSIGAEMSKDKSTSTWEGLREQPAHMWWSRGACGQWACGGHVVARGRRGLASGSTSKPVHSAQCTSQCTVCTSQSDSGTVHHWWNVHGQCLVIGTLDGTLYNA